MDTNNFTLRDMRETDLPTCLTFTQQVKWPHRMGDWELHFSQGKGTIIEDADGEIAGCILWWDYGSDYATVGLVVVPIERQGNGLGRTLMDTIMAQTGTRSLQLVATVAGKRLYQQCGFEECGFVYQVQGELALQPEPTNTSLKIETINAANLSDVQLLDADAYGCNRESLLTAVAQAGKGLVAYDDDKAVGFAMLRTSGHGQTLGPVMADSDATARALISRLMADESGFIRFDLTDKALSIKPWLESLGLAQVDKVSVMVKGKFLPSSQCGVSIYSLISQAFG